MNITPVSQNNFSAALDLIRKCRLPANDISEVTKLFVLQNGRQVIGTIGLEYEGKQALLRSLSVAEESRSSGLGNQLVAFIEDFARRQGVTDIYLLTTTAASFFQKRGYQTIQRSEVSEFIRQSSEFSGTCPASATIMKKTL